MEIKRTRYLTERETEILKSFPGLSQEDLDGCNALFRGYMIYQTEKEGRRVWTSCCHRDGELLPWLEQTMTPERNEARTAKHNEFIRCPFCGRSVQVKCRGKFQSPRSTYERVPVVFLHVTGEGNVYAQAYIAVKDYGARPADYPVYSFDSAFYFYPGGGIRFDEWYGEYRCTEEKGKIYSKKRILEPFYKGGMAGHEHYKVIFVERLEQSFARYCDYRRWARLDAPGAVWCDDLIRWMLCAAIYPRQMEMLIKAGQTELVNDLIWQSKKNVAVFDWNEPDPRRAFGMTKEELKLYLSDNSGLDSMYAMKLLGKPYAEARAWLTGIDALPLMMLERLCKEARERNLMPEELRKYLLRFTGPRCYGGWFGLQQALTLWEGYIANAEQIGFDLTNRDRLLPRSLEEAHNDAEAILQRMKEKEDRQKRKLLNLQGKERESKLNELYGFETEHYLIRAPHSMEEIIREGKMLRHCVGGYAQRHMEGKCTILLLRDKAHPKTPLCTIEVDGYHVVQVHGYRNEMEKGSVKPDIRFAEILAPWRRWLGAGMPRYKDGTPKLPKQRKEKTA